MNEKSPPDGKAANRRGGQVVFESRSGGGGRRAFLDSTCDNRNLNLGLGQAT